MTHILIPIAEVELLPKIASDFVKNHGKQISLDEKDIEEKANKVFPINKKEGQQTSTSDYDIGYDVNSDSREGYKQALKDLLL